MARTSIHATIGNIAVAPPTERRALLNVASALLPGALVLANAHETGRESLVFLLGHITECMLKSIALMSEANTKEIRDPNVRHNLEELWRLATAECTQLQKEIPPWVEALNRFHNKPYVSRYMKDVFSYSLPAIEPSMEGVISLHAIAKEFV